MEVLLPRYGRQDDTEEQSHLRKRIVERYAVGRASPTIEPEEISKAIRILKRSKVPGIDGTTDSRR